MLCTALAGTVLSCSSSEIAVMHVNATQKALSIVYPRATLLLMLLLLTMQAEADTLVFVLVQLRSWSLSLTFIAISELKTNRADPVRLCR